MSEQHDCTVYWVGERDIRDETGVECYWCGDEITDNVATVVVASTGDHDTCIDCRQDRPWGAKQ